MQIANRFKEKRVLVTGATGLIGYNLVTSLVGVEGIAVIAHVRDLTKAKRTFIEYLRHPSISFVVGDVKEPIDHKVGLVDYIFHAAGPQENDIILNDPVGVICTNLFGVKNCLEYLKCQELEYGSAGRLICFSSVTIYQNPIEGTLLVTESDTHYAPKLSQANASYAESKRMIEVLCSSYNKQHGVDVVIGRLSTVYGFCPNPTNTAFFEFIISAVNHGQVRLQNRNGPRRDNIYVDDAIRGLLKVALDGKSGEIFNISSSGDLGNFASVGDFATKIAQYSGATLLEDQKASSTQETRGWKSAHKELLLSNQKLVSLGWSLETELFEGIRRSLQLFEDSKNLINTSLSDVTDTK